MWETIKSGGPAMVPLCLFAVLSIAYTIERMWVLLRTTSTRNAQTDLEELEDILASEGEEAAARRCSERTGALNYIYAALMRRFDKLMIEQRGLRETRDAILQVAAAGGQVDAVRASLVQKELGDLKDELVYEVDQAGTAYLGRNLLVLRTIANIATLTGLLGTIAGMIRSFDSIAQAGTGDPKVVASGISEALITTATGLIIAIPTLVSYQFLSSRADASREELEPYGHAFANALITTQVLPESQATSA
jgi:biopolymer transport protein ExbB